MGKALQHSVVDCKPVLLLDPRSHTQHDESMGGKKRKKDGSRPIWAERLTAMRVLTGQSQTAFAKSIGISQQRYGKYETGGAEPNVETWLKIADRLDTSVDQIMRGPVLGNAETAFKAA
jgi:DNA-binding XRE family transcriptional regulator